MKKDEKLIKLAINSKCVICGENIGYFKFWQCAQKGKQYFFAHENCLKLKEKKTND